MNLVHKKQNSEKRLEEPLKPTLLFSVPVDFKGWCLPYRRPLFFGGRDGTANCAVRWSAHFTTLPDAFPGSPAHFLPFRYYATVAHFYGHAALFSGRRAGRKEGRKALSVDRNKVRTGPNRPAADMEGYGEFCFLGDFRGFLETFLKTFR